MTLEGVLGPNSALDAAAGIAVKAPDALAVATDGRLLFSSDRAVFALEAWNAAPSLWRNFAQPVTALFTGADGLVAVGLASAGLVVCDRAGQEVSGWSLPTDLSTVTDGVFLSDGELVVVESGYGAGADQISLACWDSEPRGRVLHVSRTGASRVLADGLHAPMGIACDDRGDFIVTELERAQIVDLAGRVRQSGYPAYLGRLRRTSSGYIMAGLARRDPLIEFMKTERDFVAEMRTKMAPQHWIAPRLSPDFSHDLPIELGATRLFGEIKPWAPSFSYGLVIALDRSLMPVGAAHSRANGRRHAISDVLSWRGDVIAVAKGSNEILNLGGGGCVS